jgi:hypothetical protein
MAVQGLRLPAHIAGIMVFSSLTQLIWSFAVYLLHVIMATESLLHVSFTGHALIWLQLLVYSLFMAGLVLLFAAAFRSVAVAGALSFITMMGVMVG